MPKAALNNIAMPHGDRDGDIYKIPRNGIHGIKTLSAAAGGIVCNAEGMTQWLKALLDTEKNNDNNTIFSAEQLNQMWGSYTILSVSDEQKSRNNTHFKTYGMGWRKEDVHGYEIISHTGTLSGMQAYVALIPELELGVVLLNNGSNSGARKSVMQSIINPYMEINTEIDWVEYFYQQQMKREKRKLAKKEELIGSGKVLLENSSYTGSYKDRWFGGIEIAETDKGLRLSVEKMINLRATLEPFEDHSFVVRWDNKNAASDAFIHFAANVKGEVPSFTLYPFSTKEHIDHEYRDMVFLRQSESTLGEAE